MGSGQKFEQTKVRADKSSSGQKFKWTKVRADKSLTGQKREIIEFVTFVENIQQQQQKSAAKNVVNSMLFINMSESNFSNF